MGNFWIDLGATQSTLAELYLLAARLASNPLQEFLGAALGISAAALLRGTHPQVRWLFCGEGPFRTEAVRLAGEAGLNGEAVFLGIVAPEKALVTPARVGAAHAAGLQVVPWTANTAEEWERLAAAGVDAIITDDPAALLDFLRERKLR